MWTDAERVTNGEGQLGAIQRVEMKFIDVLFLEQLHLFYSHAGCDEFARLGIVVEPVETLLQPFRHAGTTLLGTAPGAYRVEVSAR